MQNTTAIQEYLTVADTTHFIDTTYHVETTRIFDTTYVIDTTGFVDTIRVTVFGWLDVNSYSFLNDIPRESVWEMVIAAAAIITLGVVFRSFSANRRSRRAILLPVKNPGHCLLTDFNPVTSEIEPAMQINLKNYGQNPSIKALYKLFFYDDNRLLFGFTMTAPNPIPPGGKIILQRNREALDAAGGGMAVMESSQYIVLKMKYKDQVLGKTFTETLRWNIANGQLTELSVAEFDSLVKIEVRWLSKAKEARSGK